MNFHVNFVCQCICKDGIFLYGVNKSFPDKKYLKIALNFRGPCALLLFTYFRLCALYNGQGSFLFELNLKYPKVKKKKH